MKYRIENLLNVKYIISMKRRREGGFEMENSQMHFAGLNENDLREIKQLEQKTKTVLIAYSKDCLQK